MGGRCCRTRRFVLGLGATPMRRFLALWRRRRPGRKPPPPARTVFRPPAASQPGSHRRVASSPVTTQPARPGANRAGQSSRDGDGGATWPGSVTGASRGPAGGGGVASSGGRGGSGGAGAARGSGRAMSAGAARAAMRPAPAASTAEAARARTRVAPAAAAKAAVPWYERAQRTHAAPGHRHCGHLEQILHRDWQVGELPPPQIVLAIDRLAEFPQLIKERLVAGLDAIYVGPGGVPDLDDMGGLHGTPLPSGRATWDACAGAYGERKVIVGSRPSPTPDVMCHEIGHALDDIDGIGLDWQSDSDAFGVLYEQCLPWMGSEFHTQGGRLGRREFFADAFAAIASSQRPALVEMVGGNTRAALNVMLYFNVRYGI